MEFKWKKIFTELDSMGYTFNFLLLGDNCKRKSQTAFGISQKGQIGKHLYSE